MDEQYVVENACSESFWDTCDCRKMLQGVLFHIIVEIFVQYIFFTPTPSNKVNFDDENWVPILD